MMQSKTLSFATRLFIYVGAICYVWFLLNVYTETKPLRDKLAWMLRE